SLIKKYHPHYNIALRDDKQYFLFRLDLSQAFPRLEIVRQARQDGARYFGPFTQALAARETWKLLHKTFGLRRCTDRAMKNRIRPCLYFHLKQCQAPCVEAISQAAYHQAVEKICALLSGQASELLANLKTAMFKASEELNFEEAALLRDQIKAIEKTIEQQAVILPGKKDTDVLGLALGEKGVALALLFVRQGSICESCNFYWPGLSLEDTPELLLAFLSQYYAFKLPPPRILLPYKPKDALEEASEPSYEDLKGVVAYLQERRQSSLELTIPQNSLDEQLLEVACTNAKEEARRRENLQASDILSLIAKALHLEHPPLRIECVDVSHHQGKETRVGMVVYLEGSPSKKDYRLYKLPDSRDDYASLALWVERRIETGPPWPDLLLIDGGLGQLSVVKQKLSQLNKSNLFALAGIAKARNDQGQPDRHKGNVGDHLFLPNRTNPLPLKAGSPEILFLQQIRDATHHFAITGHRRAHNRTALESELLNLPHIGTATAKLLWDKFKTLEQMRKASLEDLQQIPGIGAKRALQIKAKLEKL
ncbi:MAG: excinuclease ABC subunit UvrC, partial [Desulfovibrionaceae bacterium]|nr:excinuclease ABC subunit UvrC [Desulfovibrionaceae bacterium]